MKSLKAFLIVLVLSMGFQAQGNNNYVELKDAPTWEQFFEQYSDHVNSFMDLGDTELSNMSAIFRDGMFYMHLSKPGNTYEVLSSTTYTSALLPNWHDLLNVDRWMDAVEFFESLGWDVANNDYGLGPLGWDRDDEIHFGEGFCSDGGNDGQSSTSFNKFFLIS
jgi:hypothetical protein